MSSKKVSVDQINRMDYTDFISTFGSVIEHCYLAAATVWSSRPFPDSQGLHQVFADFLHSLSTQAKSGVIRCHPDLAGRLAEEKKLTKESLSEQKAAGLLELTATERHKLASLNTSYKAKFGFPFVICARENKKEMIMKGIESRLENSVAEEVETALLEISKIAFHRIKDIVNDSNTKL